MTTEASEFARKMEDERRQRLLKEAELNELEYKRVAQLETGIKGVGKDAPISYNEKGAGQSTVGYRFDLLDPLAMFKMTEVLKAGAEKYGPEDWRNIDIADHLNHLLIHVYAYLAGDQSDDHLSHIMCRSMFAQAVDLQSPSYIELRKQLFE